MVVVVLGPGKRGLERSARESGGKERERERANGAPFEDAPSERDPEVEASTRRDGWSVTTGMSASHRVLVPRGAW